MTKNISFFSCKFLISTINNFIVIKHMFLLFNTFLIIFVNKRLMSIFKFELIILKFSSKIFLNTIYCSRIKSCFSIIYSVSKTLYFIYKVLIIILNKSTIFINYMFPIYSMTCCFSLTFNFSNFLSKISNNFFCFHFFSTNISHYLFSNNLK